MSECVAASPQCEVFRASLDGGVGDVCMKRMMTLRLEEGAEAAELLLHEVLLLSKLRHPNIVQFLGACLEQPHFGLLTEWMALGSLWHLLHDPRHAFAAPRRPPEWPHKKWRMAIDAARGMCYLHAWQPPLVHRDLKTLNLLVDGRFRAKVADFGHSRWQSEAPSAVGGASAEVVPHGLAGTPAYLAPEAIQGVGSGALVDVYAFGIVLWELFAERIPHQGLQPATVLYQVVASHRRPPLAESVEGSTREPLAPPLTALIEACWSGYPERRPGFAAILPLLHHLAPDRESALLVVAPRGSGGGGGGGGSGGGGGGGGEPTAQFAITYVGEAAEQLHEASREVIAQLPLPLRASQVLGRDLLEPLLKRLRNDLRCAISCTAVAVDGRDIATQELRQPLAAFHTGRPGVDAATRVALRVRKLGVPSAPGRHSGASPQTFSLDSSFGGGSYSGGGGSCGGGGGGPRAPPSALPDDSATDGLTDADRARLQRIDPTFGHRDGELLDLQPPRARGVLELASQQSATTADAQSSAPDPAAMESVAVVFGR